MARDIPRQPSTGAQSRAAAYRLVAQYLAAVPPPAGESDDRLWRAVDLALDATGLPPMTAPALTRPATVAEDAVMIQRAGGLEPTPRSARPARPDELHGGRIGTSNDGQSPRWRDLVLEHGFDAARVAILARIAAGGPITGLPSSWEDHVAWMTKNDLADQVDVRAGLAFDAEEAPLLADQGVPSHAVAAILGRRPEPIDKKRQRLRNGRSR